MIIPEKETALIDFALEQVEICNVSQGDRGAAYRQYSQIIETGRPTGGLALGNRLYAHNDRLASHLFCPTDARFTLEFENTYNEAVLRQGEMAARLLTRAFNRRGFDLTFSESVRIALDYGAAIIKLTGKTETLDINGSQFRHIKSASARVVPPWLLGVENESRNGLTDQEALCETVFLNKYDVMRRIAHFPDRDKIWRRIESHASNKGGGPTLPSSFIQVLSTSQLNIAPQGSTPPGPGGIVQIAGDPLYSTVGPQVMSEQYQMMELWVWDDARADWLMIQMILPDVLIAPRYKRVNEFCDDCLPYVLVQPNVVPGYFWGRSEIIDLIPLQTALSETMDDYKRLIGVQYDKKLAFMGFDGDGQELFDEFRSSGWVAGRQGAEIKDLTPQLPPQAVDYMKILVQTMDDVSGFGNILSGQGEAGVRAGNHANTLMKTASPRLRDRSLIVERNYAQLGDLYLSYMEAKDGNQYHTDPEKPEETAFLLDQIPDDRHVMVDSHSSSPIYENDHNQLAAFGLKSGLIDKEDAIDMLHYPNADELKRKARKRDAAQAKFIQEHPEQVKLGGKR